jgi:hypothetical protein
MRTYIILDIQSFIRVRSTQRWVRCVRLVRHGDGVGVGVGVKSFIVIVIDPPAPSAPTYLPQDRDW